MLLGDSESPPPDVGPSDGLSDGALDVVVAAVGDAEVDGAKDSVTVAVGDRDTLGTLDTVGPKEGTFDGD